jgi:HK97 family phage major capsid protein
MSEIKELLARASIMFEEVKAVYANDQATAEDQQNAEKKMADAKALQVRAAKLSEILGAVDDIAPHIKDTLPPDPNTPMKWNELREFWSAIALAGNVKYRGPLDPRLFNWKGDEGEAPTEVKHTGKTEWEQKVTMQGGVGAYGGFLIPTEFLAQLQAVTPADNPWRARATVIPMRRRQINIPVLDQTTTTAGIAHWFGGIQAYWTEEGGTKSQADAKFRQIELVAHKLICYTRTTDELLDDSAIGLDAFLRGPLGFAGAIRWYEEYAFLRGTGAGQPLGVINAGATIAVTPTTSPPIPANIYTDLVSMVESFLPGANGVWFINQRHMSDLWLMNGPAGNASYVWGNAQAGMPPNLLGYPFIFTEKLPPPGTAGSILLADPRYYLIGDRQATTIDSTNIERFRYDETSWRAVHRVDGQPWLSTPLTLEDGVTTVSPFVVLGAKST